jgi:hypothetical protein
MKNLNKRKEGSRSLYDFVVDELMKQMSFKVSGLAGTTGTTIVPVSDVLEGPYIVTIDGIAITDFETIEDAGRTLLKITYSHSERTVTISGTNVVPEFSFVMLAMAIALGTILTITTLLRKSDRLL